MEHQSTIIVAAAVTKPDALSAISRVLGSPVRGAAAHPYVSLPGGGRVTVEVPKFGEAPPLAIDVFDPRSAADARAAAEALLQGLGDATGWPIHHLLDSVQ
ncbi:MAG: hypothetical protein R6W83_01980 [Cryobacterium sp.]